MTLDVGAPLSPNKQTNNKCKISLLAVPNKMAKKLSTKISYANLCIMLLYYE